jgi:dTDP-4-dehydrorhamnose 3,5-epimerase
MIFQGTPLPGAYVIEPKKIEDDRGFFARIWCKSEFTRHGLKSDLAQTNIGFSTRKGTLRGLHFQKAPHAEVKIVRCTKGAVYDVIVDLRPESSMYKAWFGVELSEENRKMIYVPEGFAQGYITLADNSEIYYHTSEFYHPESASGVRYNDRAFGIAWPGAISVISQQDSQWPDYLTRS